MAKIWKNKWYPIFYVWTTELESNTNMSLCNYADRIYIWYLLVRKCYFAGNDFWNFPMFVQI